MKSRHTLFTVIVFVGIVIDQITKIIVDRSMQLFDSIPIVDGFFNLTYVRNKGAAFSFLSHASWRLPFFICVSIIAAAVILIAFRKL
ncbi:MAG TPA: signal peptidase II, partial [Desulfuromonadales bacterium]|nr:signal peptidase II [Desulfuromonadales bacterium]